MGASGRMAYTRQLQTLLPPTTLLGQVTGRPHPRDAPLDTSRVASIRMGTTVATNALLERKGGWMW